MRRWASPLVLALALASLVTYWRSPATVAADRAVGRLDAAALLAARRRADSLTQELAAAPVRAIAADSPPSSAVGGAPFSPGQSEQARASVRMAIEKQRPPPGDNELWGGVQSGWEQANKESDNVRALLQADGMLKWRADVTRLPPRRPANASMEQLLEHVPVGSSAWLAFGNAVRTHRMRRQHAALSQSQLRFDSLRDAGRLRDAHELGGARDSPRAWLAYGGGRL